MTTWPEIIQSWEAVLQVPTMLVDVATTGASKVTTAPIPKIPQSVVNAASGQMATPADINALLPSVSLPDFSGVFDGITSDVTKTATKWGEYALVGGAALFAGYLLMRKT